MRGQHAALKRDITNGTTTLRGLLDAPSAPAPDCTVAELLQTQAGWGLRKTQRFLTRHQIAEHRRLGQLTARQRSTMAANLA